MALSNYSGLVPIQMTNGLLLSRGRISLRSVVDQAINICARNPGVSNQTRAYPISSVSFVIETRIAWYGRCESKVLVNRQRVVSII